MTDTDVHIFNVGAGSCTVVKSPSGHVSMVDVNDGGDQRSYETERSQRQLTDPIDWCRRTYGTDLFRFILSHPDADHMAGLRRILSGVEMSATNFWDLPHHRARTEADCKTEDAWGDWAVYEVMRGGHTLEGVTWPTTLGPLRGDVRDFWREDSFEILSPTAELVSAGDESDSYNDASYVIRIRHATSSVLIAGDIEEPAWKDMIEAGVGLRVPNRMSVGVVGGR
jgi:competence protein ComEC